MLDCPRQFFASGAVGLGLTLLVTGIAGAQTHPGICLAGVTVRPVLFNPEDIGPFRVRVDADTIERSLIQAVETYNDHSGAGVYLRYDGRTTSTTASPLSGEIVVVVTSETVCGQRMVTAGGCGAAGINVRLRDCDGNTIAWQRESVAPGSGIGLMDGTFLHELGHATGFFHPTDYATPLPDWDTVTAFTAEPNEDTFLYDRDINSIRSWNGPTLRQSWALTSLDRSGLLWAPFPNVVSTFGSPMNTTSSPAIADYFGLQPPAVVGSIVESVPRMLSGGPTGWSDFASNPPTNNGRRAISVAAAPTGEVVAIWLDYCRRCTNAPCMPSDSPTYCAIGWAWTANLGVAWTTGYIGFGSDFSGTNGRVSVDYDPFRSRFVAFFVDPTTDSVVSTHTPVQMPTWSTPMVALDSSGPGPGTRLVCGAAFGADGTGLFAGTVSQLNEAPEYCTTRTTDRPCSTGTCIRGLCGGSPRALNLDRLRLYEVEYDDETDSYVLGAVGSIGRDSPGEDVTARSCGIGYDGRRERVLLAWTDQYGGRLMLSDRIGLSSAFPNQWSTPYRLLDGVHGSVDIAFLSGPGLWMLTFSDGL